MVKNKKNRAYQRRKHPSREGAIELSMTTIVILVLAMSMLILGLVLIRTIFSGATGNVQTMNEKVKAEIGRLFEEDQRTVLHLPDRMAKMKQGESFGVGFGIQNKVQTQKFKWKVLVKDDQVKQKCGVSDTIIQDKWITGGQTGSAEIASGQKYIDIIRFNIPQGAVTDISKCVVRLQLIVNQEDGTPYSTEPFDAAVIG